MPFVYGDLVHVLHCLNSRFNKLEVIDKANTSSKLLKLDLIDSKIWHDPSKVDVGVGASKLVPSGENHIYIISSKVSAEKKFRNSVEILYKRDSIISIVVGNAKLQFCSLSF